eukprot:Gb_03080 [translate_table: standard]
MAMYSDGVRVLVVILMVGILNALGCDGVLSFIPSSPAMDPSVVTSPCSCDKANGEAVKAGYWPSDANSYLPAWNINVSLYTHLFYAFTNLDDQTFTVTVPLEEEEILATFSATVKEMNSAIKTLVSIGGGASNASVYSIMAANSTLRKSFIESSIALARQHGFNGLDLDWEFPESSTDMINFASLLIEWRERVHEEAVTSSLTPLLLTAAVYFSQQFFDGESRDYPIQTIADNLDWINVMCFDYHGSWNTSQTGPHAALYDPTSHLSTSYGIGSWLDAGIPAHKVVMGMPLYGRSWMLKNKKKVGIGAPAVAAGPRQKLSDQAGFMMFSEIENFVLKNNASVVFDNATVSAYCYAGDVWIGYDNEESVNKKTMFAKDRGLLGYFFWAVSHDWNWTLSTQASETWDEHCAYGRNMHNRDIGDALSPAASPSSSPVLPSGSSPVDAVAGSGIPNRDTLSLVTIHLHYLLLLGNVFNFLL